MGQKVTRTDFDRSYTDEPHASRRKEILKIHPEIKTLFGPDPMLAVWVTLLVVLQMICMCWAVTLSWPMMFIVMYVVGGTLNHSLMLGNHEICHNLAFGHSYPMSNRMLGLFCNLPLGVPSSITFRHYHLRHHKFQGQEVIDADLPCDLEGKLFCTTFGKLIWVSIQSVFYGIRPLLTSPKPISGLEVLNALVQLTFNAAVVHYVGYTGLVYLIGGTILGMGLHPVAGHFIAEHYVFNRGQETYSYYGPLNLICFNVGYHNEHHDFPFVAGSRLPQVRAMAPEFYNNLKHHDSWTRVIYDFIMDPEIGPYARVKRQQANAVESSKSE